MIQQLVPYDQLVQFGFRCSNRGTPISTPGTQVTAGSSDTQGSFVELLATGTITRPLAAITIWVVSGAAAGSAREALMEIGIDPAGGSSYYTAVPEFPISRASVAEKGGLFYSLPLYVPKNASLAVKVRGSGTTTNRRIIITGYGDPSAPFRSHSYWETVGTRTGSSGPTITQGASGADPASWTLLGQLQRNCSWFDLGAGLNDTSTNAQSLYCDLGWSPINSDTDGSTIQTILEDVLFQDSNTNEDWSKFPPGPWQSRHYVKAGMYLYARASTDLASPETAFNVMAVCGGG